MRCFHFYNGEKKEEPKSTTRPNSGPLSFADHEVRQSGSESNPQNASDSSFESRGRNQLPNMSERTSNLKHFTFSELKQATKNFNRTAKLGEGGFGCVFKGIISSSEDPSKKMDVAVKQLGRSGLQGHKEWVTEVNILCAVEHPNLVKLVGYCAEDDERGIQRLLIYEYMRNGCVEDHLSLRSVTPLSWETRLKIALDAARGLAYLHEEMDFQIIFRDFKSSNILLDDLWNAKLSDFGLARLGPAEGLTHVSTAVVGTAGYAAPEYILTGRLTSKSDVWSFGVFLYELITGRRPLDMNRPRAEQKLVEWVKPYVSDARKFRMILDPRLDVERKHIIGPARKLSLIANRCLAQLPKARPSMGEVREMIRRVLEDAPVDGFRPKGLDQKNEGKGKKSRQKTTDMKMCDDGWLLRVWTSKVVVRKGFRPISRQGKT